MVKPTKTRSKAKKQKSVGLTRPKGQYFRCSVCGVRRKTMPNLKKHQKEEGCKPRGRPKPKHSFDVGRLRRAGKLEGLSDKHVERGIGVAAVFSNAQEMRRFVTEVFEKNFKRRRVDEF